MDKLELKIPPPLVMLITAAEMWALARFGASAGIGSFWTGALIVIAVCSGFALATAGLFDFKRADTTIHPTKPEETSALVVSGMYRYSRNPMYLGLTLVLLAWAIYLGSIVAFFLLPLFLAYIQRFQIRPEERILAEKFGDEYTAYQLRVRRWI